MWSRIMQRFLLVFISCIFVLMLIRDAHSFNVDTKFPMLYSDTENGSHFGYTVVLHTPEGEANSQLYVGAPRGKHREKSPGKLFQCVVGEPCQEQPEIAQVNNGAWMGAALDVQAGSCNRILVCGHRWYSESEYWDEEKEENMAGTCYWRGTSTNGGYTREWIQPTYKQRLRFIPICTDLYGNFNWQIGQAGISVHFTHPVPGNVPRNLLIGAPGMYSWQGGVVKCEVDHCGGFAQQCSVPTMTESAKCGEYTGYQVNSGRFFASGELVYVASAPKSSDFKGRVIILREVFNSWRREKEWSVITSEVGSNIGEYFGASLAVGDFNGDGLDDLVVGSPLRFTEHDEGCINIYYGNRKGATLSRYTVRSICGESPGARFGTTLMTLGDLDRDGYVDLAVGAPYEADNRGAVYIYNGGPGGLEAAYSQRIAAEHVDEHLRGFGISIARPVDVDGNKYVDLAIGSYISENAVILRSHPVVRLILDISSSVKKISPNTTSFEFTACMVYFGLDAPKTITVTRTVRLVDEYSRAYFTDSQRLVHTDDVELSGRSCDNFQVSVVDAVQNIRSTNLGSVEIRMNASLANEDIPSKPFVIGESSGDYKNDGFCMTCAVLGKEQKNPAITHRLEFGVDCGEDDICESELELNFNFIGLSANEYVIGSESKSSLLIEVVNDGETAYGVQINITIPSPVEVARVPPNCRSVDVKSNSSDSTLTCDVVRPLKQGQNNTRTISLDLRHVNSAGETKQLHFIMSASTSSVNRNQDENTKILALDLKSDADISITGKAMEGIYYYGNMDSKVIEFTHEYYIEKFGRSPIEKANIIVMLPAILLAPNSNEEINFLQIYEPMGFEQDAQLMCQSGFENYLRDSSDQFDPTNEDNTASEYGPEKREKRSVDRDEENMKTEESAKFATNRMLFNCKMPNIICVTINCTTRPLQVEHSVVRLPIRMQINMTLLEKYLDKRDTIQLETQGYVNITQPANIEELGAVNEYPDTATVETTFLGRVVQEELAGWIIPVAIAGGLLLLCLVVIALVKVGFFQRKKKEELQALISAETEEKVMSDVEEEPEEEVVDENVDDV